MEENNTKQPGLFEKGGKLGWLHSTVDAFDTFLRVPGTVTKRGSHVRDSIDLKRILIIVVIALVPCALFGMWNVGHEHNLVMGTDWGFWRQFGFGFLKVLPLYLVSYIVGLGIEFMFAQIRGEEVSEGYLVSGMLIPLIVPVDVPLWMLAIAVAFAVIFGKEVFGGTGMNFLNPALLARAFLFFSYPSKMSGSMCWIALRHGDVIAILLGAVILLWTGIGSWKIMLSSVIGALFVGWLGNVSGATAVPAWTQLIMGGFLFGTVFMATDPVTSAQTETGKWIFGFLVGALCVTVRLFNPGYAEGMMLSILLMNTFAPLIDYCVTSAAISRRAKKAKLA